MEFVVFANVKVTDSAVESLGPRPRPAIGYGFVISAAGVLLCACYAGCAKACLSCKAARLNKPSTPNNHGETHHLTTRKQVVKGWHKREPMPV